MITVACVLKSGGRYNADWVYKLQEMVRQRLSLPHHFVCLSDIPIPGVDVILLRHDWPGWWSKIELFGPSLYHAKRILYLDLDVLVTGSLDAIAQFPADIAFTPPHHILMGTPLRRAVGVIPCYQTSCVVWKPSAGKQIYHDFRESNIRKFRGDQDWIARVNSNWPLLPVEWFRKLRQCYVGPPDGVRVILMMPEKNDKAAELYPWVKACWHGRVDTSREPIRIGQRG